MEVQGPSSVGASIPVQYTRSAAGVEEAPSAVPMTPQDEVQISEVGKMLDDITRTSGVREQRLAQIKAAIEAGTYDTQEKFDLAMSRMLQQVSQDAAE